MEITSQITSPGPFMNLFVVNWKRTDRSWGDFGQMQFKMEIGLMTLRIKCPRQSETF